MANAVGYRWPGSGSIDYNPLFYDPNKEDPYGTGASGPGSTSAGPLDVGGGGHVNNYVDPYGPIDPNNPPGSPGARPGDFYDPTGDPNAWGMHGAQGNRNLTGAQAYGGYSAMAAGPGYSPEEQNAISTQGQTTARAAFGGAREGITRDAALTGNRGQVTAGLAEVGRQEGVALGDQARGNQIEFAQEKQRRRMAGLSGLKDMYGTETGYNASLLSGRASLARLPRRTRQDGTSTGGGGSISAGDFAGG